jgi:hypothetical protein
VLDGVRCVVPTRERLALAAGSRASVATACALTTSPMKGSSWRCGADLSIGKGQPCVGPTCDRSAGSPVSKASASVPARSPFRGPSARRGTDRDPCKERAFARAVSADGVPAGPSEPASIVARRAECRMISRPTDCHQAYGVGVDINLSREQGGRRASPLRAGNCCRWVLAPQQNRRAGCSHRVQSVGLALSASP